MAKLFSTKNDLSSNTRQAMITMLNARLADAIDLALATKQAHWNLKGPTFIGVHEMLDKLRDGLDGHTDTMAERVAQLGGTALGTVQNIAAASKLAAYPVAIHAVHEHVAALIERYATLTNAVRKNISEADEAGDAGTADIFTQISRDLDKSLWFLEAHVQEKS